jgi:hypothetical protein
MLFRVSTNSLYTCILKDLAHLQPSCSNSGAVPRRGRSKEKFPPEANELEEKKSYTISQAKRHRNAAIAPGRYKFITHFGLWRAHNYATKGKA